MPRLLPLSIAFFAVFITCGLVLSLFEAPVGRVAWLGEATAVTLTLLNIPAGYGNLVLTTIGLIIVTQIVMQAVLAFGSGSAPAATSHEKIAALKTRRNANSVMTLGILAAVGSIFLPD